MSTTKKLTREELKQKLKNKLEAKKIQRYSKGTKNKIIDDYCKQSGIDRKMVEQLAKLQNKNK